MIVKCYHFGVKLITKYSDYAIRTLCFMAKKEEQLFSVTELSKRLRISRSFLRSILQTLNTKHILTSYKGKGGGFKLALPAHRIFVVDLIKIFQGPIKFDNCFIKKDLCPDFKRCPLKKEIREIGDYVNKKFKSMTIQSLVNKTT